MVNTNELEIILASSSPNNDDVERLKERYHNLMDYLGEPKVAPTMSADIRAEKDSIEIFKSTSDLEYLKRRIESYASIHRISLD